MFSRRKDSVKVVSRWERLSRYLKRLPNLVSRLYLLKTKAQSSTNRGEISRLNGEIQNLNSQIDKIKDDIDVGKMCKNDIVVGNQDLRTFALLTDRAVREAHKRFTEFDWLVLAAGNHFKDVDTGFN